MCVCVRERERSRDCSFTKVRECMCVRERAKEKERGGGRQGGRERERGGCERESYYIVTIYIWLGYNNNVLIALIFNEAPIYNVEIFTRMCSFSSVLLYNINTG